MSRVVSDVTRSLTDEQIGDELARLADEFARGTKEGIGSMRIEIERSMTEPFSHYGDPRSTVRIRMWAAK